jgi:hypothetical protein
MPAKTQGYSFIMRDGTVLLAHEPGRAPGTTTFSISARH